MDELEIIRYRQLEGLKVFFRTVDYRTSHFHPEWEILWLLENELFVTCGSEPFKMSPGQMILFSPNESHEFHRADKSPTFLCVQISSQMLPRLPVQMVDGKNIADFFSKEEMEDLKRQISRIARAFLQEKENFELLCQGECNLLLYRLLSRLPCYKLSPSEAISFEKKKARLNRLIQFVDENYTHKIRLTDFAGQEHCSMSYLSHFVKETLNQSFQEYVSSVRFNNARLLIAGGKMKMLDVCMESGFSDYRYFSRAFLKQYHMTPEEYSRFSQTAHLETPMEKHSLHSKERIYSREENLKLMEMYLHKYLPDQP